MEETCLTIDQARSYFLDILKRVAPVDRTNFLSWVHINTSSISKLKNEDTLKQDSSLNSTRKSLRKILPIEACFSSEQIQYPSIGYDSDCNPKTTVHVDSFLYDEEDLDKLAEKGQLSRHYCKSCGSRDVGPLTFISHSLSISQLRYVFNFALPYLNGSDDFRSKVLLDIGSRLGSVIYSAAEFWNFKEVIGIEMNTEFCDLQQKFLQEKNYSTPIHVVCDDVRNQQEMLASANVVLMNNVFGYFQDLESQVDCWQKIRAFLQPGTILIHNPSVEAVTEHLKLDFALHQWLEPIDLNTPFELYVGNDENLYEDLYEECEHISAYRVIPPSS